jgi:hypothetical protein
LKDRKAGGRFHPSQLIGWNLSTEAEVVWFPGGREVIRILPNGRRVHEYEIEEFYLEAEYRLQAERAQHGMYNLPPMAQAQA